MKKIIKFLKSIIRRDPTAWIDIEVAAEKKVKEAVNTLTCGSVVITYNPKANNITVGETELTVTTRILTKVNNVLKKDGVETISKETWSEFEDGIIASQGKGKNTYNSLRKKVK